MASIFNDDSLLFQKCFKRMITLLLLYQTAKLPTSIVRLGNLVTGNVHGSCLNKSYFFLVSIWKMMLE